MVSINSPLYSHTRLNIRPVSLSGLGVGAWTGQCDGIVSVNFQDSDASRTNIKPDNGSIHPNVITPSLTGLSPEPVSGNISA